MSIFFTEHAATRIKQLDVSKGDLAQLLARLDAAKSGADLARWPDAISLRDSPEGNVYVVPSGSMRAVVTTGKSKPDRLIVMSVYRADDDVEAGAGSSFTSEPRAFARVG